ncbi:hypothetical protein ES319_D01G254600v1 [Gossypium barbadense]|uniref:Uncharacterized protein n=1 Tax=Gossypium barbadense TaxID=3634 RepID=A0A5J5SSR9_GOSBA|nr:hypothetical protein ES319_D01G254600v1 [Gossypium barbadense]
MRHSHGLFILVNLILSSSTKRASQSISFEILISHLVFVDHNLLNPFHYLSNSITSPKGVDALYVY